MTEYTYNQTIEYIDGTRDLNFEAARKWAQEHGTTFEEDVSKREPYSKKRIETYINPETGAEEQQEVDYPTLKRFFVIGDEPQPYTPPEPTVEELQAQKKAERNAILDGDLRRRLERYERQAAAGIETTDDAETYKALLLYSQYLRDIPQGAGEWWNAPILPFEVWQAMNDSDSSAGGENA